MTSTTNRILRTTLLLAGLAIQSGCASVPPPLQELEAATAAVQSARSNGASEHAAQQLEVAEQKLASAQQLLEKKQNSAARRVLQQVTVDAKLAVAKARLQQRDARQRALQEEINQLQRRIEAVKASS